MRRIPRSQEPEPALSNGGGPSLFATTYEPHTFQMACTITPDLPPPDNWLLQGQLYLELNDPLRMWVGVPSSISSNGRRLFFDATMGPTAIGAEPDPYRVGYYWYDSGTTTLNLNTGSEATPILTPVGGTGYIDTRVAPALTAANVAQTTANNAQTAAATADGKATAAQTTANSAQTAATAAQATADAAMPKAGGIFSGAVTLAGDPASAMQPATKQYTDAIGTTAGNAMPKTGGQFTGPVTLANAATLQPVNDVGVGLGAAAKKWSNVYSDVLNVGAGNVPVLSGTGSPEGAITAPVGALFLRTDGTNAVYAKQSGTGNTGWSALSAADPTTAIQAAMSAGDNLLHNGDFRIWQRGTNFPGANTTVRVADRWQVWTGTNGTVNSSQLLQSLGATVGGTENLDVTISLNRTVVGSDDAMIFQAIEGVRTANGQTLTLSFWILAPIASTTYYIQTWQRFGTGGSPSSAVTTAFPFTINTANTWERKVVTLAVPSIAGKTLGTNGDDSLGILIYLPRALGTGTWQFANIDCRLGSVAPAKFLRRPLEEELALCQRYYQTHAALVVGGYSVTGGEIFEDYLYPTTMRIAPTVTLTSPSYGNSSNVRVLGGPTFNHVPLVANVAATGGATVTVNLALDAEL